MRNAYATKIEPVKPCKSESFFKLRDRLWEEKVCPAYPLHRFFTLMRKMRAASYVEEQLRVNAELLEEQKMASDRCRGTVKIALAKRLTFFASFPSSEAWDDKKVLPDEHLLGYAVIVTLGLPDDSRRTYLLEAVIRPPSVVFGSEKNNSVFMVEVPNYYVHNTRTFETCLGPEGQQRVLTIEGSFFTQQNDLTSVCAHAALRMAINSCGGIRGLEGLANSGKLTNRHINEILGLDFSRPTKMVGHYDGDNSAVAHKQGLTREDIQAVVESLGARLLFSNFVEEISVDYDEFMYPLVESHLPTILEVEGWDTQRNQVYAHALAVMGHTLNSDRWEPEANVAYGKYPRRAYIQVCEWVCHYVISDDNYGMNVTLPTRMVRNDLVPHKNPNLHATRVMSIVPRRITLAGYTAQRIAVTVADAHIAHTRLSPPNYWLGKLSEHARKGHLVCRTLLQRKRSYQQHVMSLIEQGLVQPTAGQRAYFASLPEHFWVTEVSIPNLYAGNKAKLGEVLVDATASKREIKERACVLLAWFPGFLRHRSKDRSEIWNVKNHVPLIRKESLPLIEW